MKESLYEITGRFAEILSNLEVDEDGVVVNFEQLSNAEGDFTDKVEAVACYIKDLKMLSKAISEEKSNLAKRESVLENKIDSLKNYVASNMRYVGKEKIETAKCKVSFRKSTSVEIYDENILPEKFVNTSITTKPDKALIKETIKAGGNVPGASLVENSNLQIK